MLYSVPTGERTVGGRVCAAKRREERWKRIADIFISMI
jgi:hypothetical protein